MMLESYFLITWWFNPRFCDSNLTGKEVDWTCINYDPSITRKLTNQVCLSPQMFSAIRNPANKIDYNRWEIQSFQKFLSFYTWYAHELPQTNKLDTPLRPLQGCIQTWLINWFGNPNSVSKNLMCKCKTWFCLFENVKSNSHQCQQIIWSK